MAMIDETELEKRKAVSKKIIDKVTRGWYLKKQIEYNIGPVFRKSEPNRILNGYVDYHTSSRTVIDKVIYNIASDCYDESLFHELFHCCWFIRLKNTEKRKLSNNCQFRYKHLYTDCDIDTVLKKESELPAYSFGVWAAAKWRGIEDENTRQSDDVEALFIDVYNGDVMHRGEQFSFQELFYGCIGIAFFAFAAIVTAEKKLGFKSAGAMFSSFF